MRLIDADELLEHKYVGVEYDRTIDDGIKKTDDAVFAFQCGWNDALQSVADFAPTIDAEPIRHGHWIDGNDEIFIREGSREYVHITTEICSNCKGLIIHAWTFGYVKYHYCPNCGAKMDGGGAE